MRKIFNCTGHYLNNFAQSHDESSALFKMAFDFSSYRLLVLLIGRFFQGQALGARRRIYCWGLFDNHHCDCMDYHKIYFLKTA
jgi:hypothetical protein